MIDYDSKHIQEVIEKTCNEAAQKGISAKVDLKINGFMPGSSIELHIVAEPPKKQGLEFWKDLDMIAKGLEARHPPRVHPEGGPAGGWGSPGLHYEKQREEDLSKAALFRELSAHYKAHDL